MNSVDDVPDDLQPIVDKFSYEVALIYQRARLWLGFRQTIYAHLISSVCINPCLLKRASHISVNCSCDARTLCRPMIFRLFAVFSIIYDKRLKTIEPVMFSIIRSTLLS